MDCEHDIGLGHSRLIIKPSVDCEHDIGLGHSRLINPTECSFDQVLPNMKTLRSVSLSEFFFFILEQLSV